MQHLLTSLLVSITFFMFSRFIPSKHCNCILWISWFKNKGFIFHVQHTAANQTRLTSCCMINCTFNVKCSLFCIQIVNEENIPPPNQLIFSHIHPHTLLPLVPSLISNHNEAISLLHCDATSTNTGAPCREHRLDLIPNYVKPVLLWLITRGAWLIWLTLWSIVSVNR